MATKTPYTLFVTGTQTVFSRKDRAVAAGEATGESFTVTNPKGVVVHDYVVERVALVEVVAEDTTPEDVAVAAEMNEAVPAEDADLDLTDEELQELDDDNAEEELDDDNAEEEPLGETIIGLPTVASKATKRSSAKHEGHEWRTTKSGGYCYTCDRVAAEAQKAARAAAKAAKA